MPGDQVALTRPLETARIVSSVPGRLRVRLGDDAAGGHRLASAVEALSASTSISTATPGWKTASLLIEYDVAKADSAWSELKQLGLGPDVRTTAAQPAMHPSTRVTRTVAGANALVRRRTGGNDLRALAPLGLGLLALRQFVWDDQRLADAPWYVLAWYASEIFQKHQPREEDQHG